MTVLSCGIGLVAAGFAVIVVREIAGGIVVGQLVEEDSVKPAAEAAWSIGTSLMTSIATTVIVDRRALRHRRLARLADRLGPLDPPRAGPRPARLRRLRLRRPGGHRRHLLPLSAPTQNLRSFLTTLVDRRPRRLRHPRAAQTDRRGIPRRRLRRRLRPHQGHAWSARSKTPTWASGPRNCACPRCASRADGARRRQRPLPVDSEDARLARLERLANLHEKGILTDEELAAEKARVLERLRHRRLTRQSPPPESNRKPPRLQERCSTS